MKLGEFKQRYTSQKAEAEENVRIVEAEAERLKGVVLRLGGAIMAIDELEQAQAEETEKIISLVPAPGKTLTEEEIQHALRDNRAEPDNPPLDEPINLVEEKADGDREAKT